MASQAQPYSSRLGGFSVNEKQGCAPLTVTISELQYAGFCTCNYKVAGNLIASTFVFAQPGTYTITGIAQSGSPVGADDIVIVVKPNVQPAFEIANCTAGKVSIKVTDTNYEQYLVDFNTDNITDNTIPAGGAQSAIYNYGSAGLRTISVRGKDFNAASNCNAQTQSFNSLVALPSATINTLVVVDGASIKLDYSPAAHVQYRAQVATGNAANFQQFQTFNSASTVQQTTTLNGLATDDNYYCFRVNAYDPCNNTSILSNTVCSTDFDLSLVSGINKLVWTTSMAGVTNFNINRDQTNYQTVTTTVYDDSNIVCNTDYCYSLITNYSNGSKSTSIEKCGKAFTTNSPTPIMNASATVGAAALDISWIQDPTYTPTFYSISQTIGAGPFSVIGSSTTTNYSDNGYSTLGNNCYQVKYTDICNNISPDGARICPIRLAGSIGNNNSIELTWSAYLGWMNGVKAYHISKYDNQGNLISTFNSQSLTFSDNVYDPDYQEVEYVVVAEPNDATLASSVSNRLKLTKQARLIFPTAFTPNKDNLNENFTVVGQYVENMTLQIFDRWGTLLFSTDRNEPWDGRHEGRMMPESTYVWKALITDKTGKIFTNIGMVALLRK